jgi:hypothetical protein
MMQVAFFCILFVCLSFCKSFHYSWLAFGILLMSTLAGVSLLQIFKYTICFCSTGHTQDYSLVCRYFKATATAAGSFLDWHCAAVHIFLIYSFTCQIVSLVSVCGSLGMSVFFIQFYSDLWLAIVFVAWVWVLTIALWIILLLLLLFSLSSLPSSSSLFYMRLMRC